MSRMVTGAALRLVIAAVLVSAATASGAAAPKLTVVAKNLNNPHKIFIGPDGAVYVAEAGTGGTNKCMKKGPSRVCIPITRVGPTGSITRIANGVQKRVVTGLLSTANSYEQRAEGPADLFLQGGVFYVLIQNVESMGNTVAGGDTATSGDLVVTRPGKAAPGVIARITAFEAAHNPDHGAGPGAKLGNPPIDSDPYAFTPYLDGFAVADAGANDLLWVDSTGKVSVLAVFPTQTEKLTKELARRVGVPLTQKTIQVQSVPTSVAVGPDGALYVGELTGVPFETGKARIWRVVPGKKPTVYASGFTNISDIAFDGSDLLVLEIAARGLLDPTSPGALIRISPNGKRTTLASEGLGAPTGLAVGDGVIYISNYGVYPGRGAGPHGEVVSLPNP